MAIYQVLFPAAIRFGVGALDTLGGEAEKLGARRALIVTDPGVYAAGIVDSVMEQLARTKLSVELFSGSETEPTLPRLNDIAKELRKDSYDLLIGVGGGSCIDTTKGLSVLLAHGGNGQDYVGIDKVPGPGIPMFLLPTTAGTGSEVTKVAVLDDPDKKLKAGMVSPYLLARLALIDPTLTYGCPPGITASAGIDAFVHAMESYTSINASNFIDAIEIEAMRLVVGSLRAVVDNGSDKEARIHMAEAAYFAGIGIAHAGGAAVHALGHTLGSRFHVPHGVAMGVLLPYVMEFNLSASLPKYATVAQILGVETRGLSLQEAAEKGVEAARNLVADIGISLHLRDLGVPREALEDMATATLDVTRLLANNPRQLTLDDSRSIWENAW